MKPLYFALAFAMFVSARARGAEHDFPSPPRAKDADETVSLSVGSRAGLIKAPFVTIPFPEVSGFAVVLTGTAAMRLEPLGWLRLRLPMTFVKLDFPARAQVGQTALGNLEIGVEHPVRLGADTRLGLLAALLVPSAEHGPEASLLDNRALALSSALNGGKHSALLTPGVSGVRFAASIERWRPPFAFRASLDLPLLVRISDASLPEATETHRIGVLPAMDVRASWWLTSALGASLGAGIVTELQRIQEPTLPHDRTRRLQPVAEAAVHAQIGKHVALGLDASLPVGGSLGGNGGSIALVGRWGL